MGYLNQDESDQILDMLDHAGWDVLLRLVDKYTSEIDNALFRYTSIQGPQQELFALKAQSEGARKLRDRIKAISKVSDNL